MSERVQIGDWCTLYHGDSLKVLGQLSRDWFGDESQGLRVLVTDPPYGIVEGFGNTKGRPDGTRTMQFEWDRDPHTTRDVVDIIDSALSEAAAFHTFCGPEQYGKIASRARLIGFTPKPWCWVKTCPPPAMPGNWWPSGFELAMYGYRSGAWFGDADTKRCNVYRSDTYRHGIRAHEKVDHPTQKWLPMIAHIVGSIVPPDGTAIDPFMGSGTTAVAAFMHGRRFIGIEREQKYFDLAAKRIKRQTGDGPLFEAA